MRDLRESLSRGEGMVVWICGLSGCGKTTTARTLASTLRQLGANVVVLDGDVIRGVLSLTDDADYTSAGRRNVSRRIRRLAQFLSSEGQTVIVTNISGESQTLDENRREIGSYFEVHLDASLELVIERDAKGIYRRALSGKLPHVVGVDLPYEKPRNPDLRLVVVPDLGTDEIVDSIVASLEQFRLRLSG